MKVFLSIMFLAIGGFYVYGTKLTEKVHEQHIRLPVPPLKCRSYDNKKDCVIDCKCRWCYNITKCYNPLYDDVACEHHSEKTSQCKTTGNVLDILALVFISAFGLAVAIPLSIVIITISLICILFIIYVLIITVDYVLKMILSVCCYCCWPMKWCCEDTYDRLRNTGAGKPLLKIFDDV